ncbi:hypothetical protein V8E53_015891 [Lactarius tabidus]
MEAEDIIALKVPPLVRSQPHYSLQTPIFKHLRDWRPRSHPPPAPKQATLTPSQRSFIPSRSLPHSLGAAVERVTRTPPQSPETTSSMSKVSRIDVPAKHCLNRLAAIAEGPRGRPPSFAEIVTASDATSNPSTFDAARPRTRLKAPMIRMGLRRCSSSGCELVDQLAVLEMCNDCIVFASNAEVFQLSGCRLPIAVRCCPILAICSGLAATSSLLNP